MVTIKDVAREAGVSVSTVSFAINDSNYVAAETKKRIYEVIDRLNYQPNSSARRLVTRKSNNIGLYIPHPSSDIFNFAGNNVFTDLLQGIGEVADNKDHNLLLTWDHEQKNGNDAKVLELVRSSSIDGLLFVLPNQNTEILNQLTERSFPFVLLNGNYLEDQSVNTVDINNFDAAYQNTKHLIQLGHTKIAFISPGPLEFMVCRDRYEGYVEALTDAGIKMNDQYFYIGDYTEDSGVKAMEYFMKCKIHPTAVVAGRDNQAVGILEYASAHNQSVPEDIAVVSFENTQLAEKYHITSATTDLYLIGKEASQLLFKIIAQKNKRPPQNIIIPSELVIRKSCGAK